LLITIYFYNLNYSKIIFQKEKKMKTKILLLIANILIFAMPLLATPPAEPDLAIEWQKYMYPTEISFAKFSADGNYIYCAIGNTIQKLDASNGEFLSIFEDKDKYWIYEMQISKNGNIIATRTGGGGIVLWDTQLEKSIKFIPFGTGEGSSGAFCFDITPDGNYLVVGNLTEIEEPQQQYFNLLLYDIQKSEIVKSIPINGSIEKVKISNDGKTIAIGILERKSIDEEIWYQKAVLWDYESFKEVTVLENIEIDNDWGYSHLKFSNDDNSLGVVRKNYVAAIYNMNNFTLKKDFPYFNRYCYNMTILPDSEYFLIYFYTSNNRIRDLELYYNLNKIRTYNYSGQILEISDNFENWNVLTGNGRDTLYMLKKTETSVSPSIINKENISITTNNNLISIELTDINTEQLTIIISDLLGKTIFTKKIKVSQSNSKIPINVTLNTGTYLCKVIADNKEYTQKIEIVR